MLDRIHGISYDDLQTKPVVSFEEALTHVLKFIGYELSGRAVSCFVRCDDRHVTSIFSLFCCCCCLRCSKDSILLGHSLYGDLDCLKLRHELVVDTAFIFTVKVPSLIAILLWPVSLSVCSDLSARARGIFLVDV
jgi:hypothetical protein